MPIRQKLTKRVIDATAPIPGAMHCVWDTEIKGFRLRVHPSGRKCFELYYRVGCRQRLFKIGDYGAFTPEQARKAAEKFKYQVGTGADPQYEKETIRRAANVNELIALYLKDGRIDKPNKREVSWKTDETYLRCHVAPLLGTRGLFELKTPDIAKWQADVIAGKTAGVKKLGFRRKSNVRGGRGVAGRATRCLATMFAWAVKREIMADNPAKRVEKIPDKQRERFLTDEEAVSLFTTLDDMEQCGEMRPDFADLFRLLALTGARLAEIKNLAWTEIDRANRMIVLEPDRHKTGRTGRRSSISTRPRSKSWSGAPIRPNGSSRKRLLMKAQWKPRGAFGICWPSARASRAFASTTCAIPSRRCLSRTGTRSVSYKRRSGIHAPR